MPLRRLRIACKSVKALEAEACVRVYEQKPRSSNEVISATRVINVCNYCESVEITFMDGTSKLYINSVMRFRYQFG